MYRIWYIALISHSCVALISYSCVTIISQSRIALISHLCSAFISRSCVAVTHPSYISLLVWNIPDQSIFLACTVISTWNNSTSALEVNQVLNSLDEICQQDCAYQITPKLIAYKDKFNENSTVWIFKSDWEHTNKFFTVSNHFSEEHEDYQSYQACEELFLVLNAIKNRQVILLSRLLNLLPEAPTNWPSCVLIRHRNSFFVFNDSFDPDLISCQMLKYLEFTINQVWY